MLSKAYTYTDEASENGQAKGIADSSLGSLPNTSHSSNAVIATNSVTLPSLIDSQKSQIIRFGTGIQFELPGEEKLSSTQPSAVVLPCIFGSRLEGPVLLATGTTPSNVPFLDEVSLLNYYKQLKNAVVIVDDRMTDNARNLATTYRINALFIVQLSSYHEPKNTDDVLLLLNSANINAVTALAGPQSLVLIQISDKYYFYRGLANRAHLNTSKLAFGSDVTSVIESVGLESLTDPRIERLVKLQDATTILLPTSGQLVKPQDLQKAFKQLPVEHIRDMEEDISAAIPQLQTILNQQDLQELSKTLVSTLSEKISNAVTPLKNAYVEFLTKDCKMKDPESVKKKNTMLGEWRKTTKEIQMVLKPVISSLSNMISTQTTSKRTHDLKRLVRQSQIQGNVEAAQAMTFDTVAEYLETYAEDMGVMLLNIEETPYRQLLDNFMLKSAAIDARYVRPASRSLVFPNPFVIHH